MANKAVKSFVAMLPTRTRSAPRLFAHGCAIVARTIAPTREPLAWAFAVSTQSLLARVIS